MLKIFTLLVACFSMNLSAQQIINGAHDWQSESQKEYAIYIPSEYDEQTPHQLMLGLHPLNTNRWDATSWRDTLIQFAEMNDLILVCPDGGPDGRINDDIDTSFTTALLDSMKLWYNIDQDEKYIMGFSWGGKTTYTYGLNNADKFKGFMPIGAAIESFEINSISNNSINESFYVVHGSQDAPNTRYFPLLDILNANDACVNSNLIQGVGHTIDFPNRNQMLTEAFQWLKNNECDDLQTAQSLTSNIELYPNPSWGGIFAIKNISLNNDVGIVIYNAFGEQISYSIIDGYIHVSSAPSGLYFLIINDIQKKRIFKRKIVIL